MFSLSASALPSANTAGGVYRATPEVIVMGNLVFEELEAEAAVERVHVREMLVKELLRLEPEIAEPAAPHDAQFAVSGSS